MIGMWHLRWCLLIVRLSSYMVPTFKTRRKDWEVGGVHAISISPDINRKSSHPSGDIIQNQDWYGRTLFHKTFASPQNLLPGVFPSAMCHYMTTTTLMIHVTHRVFLMMYHFYLSSVAFYPKRTRSSRLFMAAMPAPIANGGNSSCSLRVGGKSSVLKEELYSGGKAFVRSQCPGLASLSDINQSLKSVNTHATWLTHS